MEQSIYKQVLDEIVTRIRDLDLTGIHDSEIQARKTPWTSSTIFRGITVSWSPETEYRPSMATSSRSAIGYPCIVTMVTGTAKGVKDGIEDISKWRQTIRREFDCTRLTTVAGTDVNNIICRVAHAEIQVPEQFESNYDVGQLVITCWFLEPRG